MSVKTLCLTRLPLMTKAAEMARDWNKIQCSDTKFGAEEVITVLSVRDVELCLCLSVSCYADAWWLQGLALD